MRGMTDSELERWSDVGDRGPGNTFGPPPFDAIRARIELAAHEEGDHEVFVDAPDWYWAIAGHLIGWRRDVYAWVGLFVAGLILGIMLRGALA